jgi:hypothetical protein
VIRAFLVAALPLILALGGLFATASVAAAAEDGVTMWVEPFDATIAGEDVSVHLKSCGSKPTSATVEVVGPELVTLTALGDAFSMDEGGCWIAVLTWTPTVDGMYTLTASFDYLNEDEGEDGPVDEVASVDHEVLPLPLD